MPRRWRVAGWALAAVAGLAVIGIGMRHGSSAPGTPGTSGTPAASAAAAPGGAGQAATGAGWTGFQSVPSPVLPLPQSHAAFVICSPSTGVCSMRGSAWQIRG